MSDNGDEKVIDLSKKFSIEELVKRTVAAQREEPAAPPERPEEAEDGPEAVPPLDRLVPLPKPGDAYKAHSRPANQMQPTLHLLTGDGQTWSFPYSGRVEGPHLLSVPDDPGKGAVLVLRFAASVAVEVILAGIHLDVLHNYLADQRIRWVREWPKGKMHRGDDMPVVRSIIVRPVSPKMEQGWPISRQAGGGH